MIEIRWLQYTDYSLVNRWWRFGHEIASHSITHRNNLTYWQVEYDEELDDEGDDEDDDEDDDWWW